MTRPVSDQPHTRNRLVPHAAWGLVSRFTPESREHLLAAAAILAFTLIFHAPLFKGRTFSMVGAHMFAEYPWTTIPKDDHEIVGRGYPQTDQAESFYPDTVFATNALRSDQFPMWLPYSFSGIPMIEVGIGTGLLYPPRLLGMLFMSPIRQHDVLIFTHLLLAGLGMYALLSCWGANLPGAIFGALAWEMNGHRAFWLILEHSMVASAWFPVMLLAATLAVRRRSLKWAVASGTAVGLSMLHGILDELYVGVLVLACWYGVITISAAVKSRREGAGFGWVKYLALPAVSALAAVGVGAASWMSLLNLLSHVHRTPLSVESQLAHTIRFGQFLQGLVSPVSASGPENSGPDLPSFAFVGLLTIPLATLAVLRRSGTTAFCAALVALSICFAVGVGPVVSILRLLPYFGALHPYSGLYFFGFGVTALAGFGLSDLTRYLLRVKIKRKVVAVIWILLISFEAFQVLSFAWKINPTQPRRKEWLFPSTPMIRELQAVQGPFHILPLRWRLPDGAWTPPVFAGKAAAIFSLRSSAGYESLLPVRTATLWRTVESGGVPSSDIPRSYRPDFFHDRLPIHLLEKLSIGFLVSPPGVAPKDTQGRDLVSDGFLRPSYRNVDGSIYRVTHALPRAFLVPQVITAPDESTALRTLLREDFDAHRLAIVEDEAGASVESMLSRDEAETESVASSASIVSDRLNEVEIKVAAGRKSLLVLNDSWDSGWKAFVDGAEASVLRVNYAFRGVVVPEGEHDVSFVYRPGALLLGILISVLSLLLVSAGGLYILVKTLRLHFAPEPELA